MTRSRIMAALLLTAVLSGCLSKAPSQKSVLDQSLPQGTTVPPAWQAETRAAGDVENEWLRSFQDPELDAVVAEAMVRNLDLAQAAAQLETVRQRVIVVSSQLKPQVGLGANVSTLRDADQPSNYTGARGLLGISWEPDIWGKLRAQREAARQEYQAAALEYAWARQSLAATTAKCWYQAVALRRMAEIQQQTVEAYAELLRLAGIRQAAGKVAGLDVAEAAANLDEMRSELSQTQGLLQSARRNLEVLLGRYPAAALEVRHEFATLPPPVPAGLPSSLLERRPDVAAAERGVLAAFYGHEAARLNLLPSFVLTFDGGRMNDHVLSVLRLNPWLYHAALGMNVPIYTGGRLSAEVKIATAIQQKSVASYGSAILAAFQEVEDGLTNERILGEQFSHLESALKQRAESVRLATIKYKAGAYDLLPVLQLQTSQYETQIQMIKLRNSRLANRIDLQLALGSGFDGSPAAARP
ncbi:MAG: efflux transporter outer membrane subunit [Acidobacteria bacterium]|nr:efflux transporter outer membrane subunit [Acidobacteriota bacterium]